MYLVLNSFSNTCKCPVVWIVDLKLFPAVNNTQNSSLILRKVGVALMAF